MMQLLYSFLQGASKGSLLFLIAFAFFHILIGTFSPDVFSEFYRLEAGKDIMLFSFRFWQIFRTFLMRIPLIGGVLSGICLLRLMRVEGFKNKSTGILLFLLLYILGPFIGYFMLRYDWGFSDQQKVYVRQTVVFWCYVIGISMSRWIGAVMSDMVIVFRGIGQGVAQQM